MGYRTETILLVDDDPGILNSTSRLLEHEISGQCLTASSGGEALAVLREREVSLLLLDLGLPDVSGEHLLAQIRQEYPDVPVIIITALVDLETAVRCMGNGAYDYVVKGGDPGRLISSVLRALESRRKDHEIATLRERMQAVSLKRPENFEKLITGSERMRTLFRFIEAVALTTEPILLLGETGTGKELFAGAVHRASGTRGPFVASNLGGLDDFVVADTLFGHVKGAFTGADEVRKGLVANAAGGTLFLDEIGDLSPPSQVKLLRFLENREYYALGSDLIRRSDARIVAATNRDLEALAEEGKFRKDLLYRLSTYRVDIPPLRERAGDIPLLCAHFLNSFVPGRPTILTPEAARILQNYDFPGNIRELRAILLRAQVVAENGVIDSPVLKGLVRTSDSPEGLTSLPVSAPPAEGFPTIRQAVDALVNRALTKTGGHQGSAAALLGITPQALSKRLRRRA